MVVVSKSFKWSFLLLLAVLISCDYKENEVAPVDRFVRYIDVQTGDDVVYPMDVVVTEDGGFLVLAILNQWQPYVLKLNELGEKMWEVAVGAPYVRPIPGLIKSGGAFYFMTSNNMGAEASYLLQINDANGDVTMVREFAGVQYPLAVSGTPSGGMLLQSYDAEGRRTVLEKYNNSWNQIWRERFDIYEDLEDPAIYNHITRNTPPLPFFNGTVTAANGNELYHYFNGFTNYTFANVFVNRDGDQTGVVQGNRYEALLSSMHSLGENAFALSRYEQDGVSYLVPRVELTASTSAQGTQLGGDRVVHWENRSPIFCSTFIASGMSYVGFLGNTQSGKVELRLYSQATGQFVSTHLFGSDNFTGHARFVQTADGGLAILAQAAIEDRFFKLVLYKFSEEELATLLE